MNEPGLLGDDAETPAVVDIQMCEVEGQGIEDAAVDDYQLVVIAHEIVGGPRNSNPRGQKAHFKLAEAFLTAPVRICNQRGYRDAAANRSLQSRFQLGTIEPEDDNLHAFSGIFDRRYQRCDSILGLEQQFQRTTLCRKMPQIWSIVHSGGRQ